MKFKHPLMRTALATLGYSFATIVVLAALLVSTARLLLPLVEDYKSEAEQLVSRYAGQTIRVSGLRAQWNGLGPEVRLKDVRVYDADGQQARLRFAEARIGIDLLASLWRQDIVPSSLTISGVQLSFTRHLDGSVSVHGLDDAEGKPDSQEDYSRLISAWLFRQPEIGIESSSLYWSDEKSGVKNLFFADVYLRLRNDQLRHQIEGSLVLPGHLGEAFGFAIDLQGDLLDPLGWAGELYIKGRGFVLPEWWPRDIFSEIGIAEGVANFELWSTWASGRLQQVEGSVDTQALKFSGSKGKQLPLTALSSGFVWRQLDSGWDVRLNRFSPVINEQAWPPSEAALIAHAETERYELSADFVRLDDVVSTAALFGLLDEARHAPLLGLQPRADLKNLIVHYSPAEAEGEGLHIEADFTALSTRPWRELPAGKGLSGHLIARPDQGYLHLDSHDAQLDYPIMFRDHLALDRLQGDLYWRHTGAGWQMDAPGLHVSNTDIKLDTRLTMLLPLEGKPYIDLVGYFREGKGKQASKYLPVNVIPEDAVVWLDRAIVDGYVPTGGFVLHGPLAKFPFDHGEGKFEVRFDVRDGVLDYEPGWPMLYEANAEVVFSGRSMRIDAHSGRILNSTVKDILMAIEDLDADNPDLQLRGLMDVQTADVLEYVARSGLGKDYAKTLQRLQASGSGELELAMRLPLEGGEEHLSGRMRFDNNTIALQDQPVSVQKLNGEVRVVDGDFRGEALHAELMGEPVVIRVEPGKRSDVALNIEARTRLDMNAGLRRYFDKSIPDIMPGKTDWLLAVQIPEPGAATREEAKLVLSSNLEGVSIAAPAPLGKTAKQRRPLRVQLGLGDTRQYEIAVSYHDILNAVLELNEAFALLRGEVALGKALTDLPKETGLVVSGQLEKLVLQSWVDYASGLQLFKGNGKSPSGMPAWLSSVRLNVGELDAFDELFRQVSLNARREDDRWQLDVESDRLAGRIWVNDEPLERPMKLDLDYQKAQRDPGGERAESRRDPRGFPGFELQVEHFIFDNVELGNLSANVTRIPEGLFMERLQLDGARTSLSASGEWAVNNGAQSTRLQAKLDSRAFSELLAELGYVSGFTAGRSSSVAQLEWSGNPMQFALHKLNGELSLDIRDGQLQDVSPGAGRVFGLLSLQTLPRRLSLDFSDVFKRGFRFDRIKGTFELERGDAYTTNMYLEGPAARIDISGRTGLAAKDYDQLVTVTPHLTASLPLAGALLGGPVAGGVLYAIDKLLKKTIDKITQYKYTITGSWDDPNIVKLAEVERPVVSRE